MLQAARQLFSFPKEQRTRRASFSQAFRLYSPPKWQLNTETDLAATTSPKPARQKAAGMATQSPYPQPQLCTSEQQARRDLHAEADPKPAPELQGSSRTKAGGQFSSPQPYSSVSPAVNSINLQLIRLHCKPPDRYPRCPKKLQELRLAQGKTPVLSSSSASGRADGWITSVLPPPPHHLPL